MQDSIYKSKVDWWLGLLIIGLFLGGLVSAAAGLLELIRGIHPGSSWLLLVSGCGVMLLIILLVYPIEYRLTDKEMVIKSGLLRSRFPYENIIGGKPSRNFLSSPALSLDRLRIDTKRKFGFVLISPENKEEFLTDLARRAPHLVYKDGILTLK